MCWCDRKFPHGPSRSNHGRLSRSQRSQLYQRLCQQMHKPPTPKPRTGSDSGDLNLTCDSHPSPLPHLRDCSQNRGTASINTSHFSTRPHPHWLTAMPLFEDVNATSSRGGDVIVHTTTGLRDILNGHLPRPKADTEGGHKIRSKPVRFIHRSNFPSHSGSRVTI